LAQDPNQDTFTAELDERLDDLFGEPDLEDKEEKQEIFELEDEDKEEKQKSSEPKEEAAHKPSAPEQSPFTELKTIVLSIDWEITNEVMDRFIAKVGELQSTYKGDQIVLVFLQLLGSIGEYIRTNLGNSHPDAFRLLNSLFAQLDRVLHTEDLAEVDRKKILSSELAKYKKLKSRLKTKKPAQSQGPAPAEKEPAADMPIEKPPLQAAGGELQSALQEIKQLIREEFKALRAELRQMRKG
jgi:hypothetical protein